MVKRGTHSEARDDVAAALVLAAGLETRTRDQRPKGWRYGGLAG